MNKFLHFVGAIACLAVFAFVGRPVTAAGARLFISPADTAAPVGSTFVTDVMVSTEGELVNAVALEIQYPKEYVSLRDAQAIGSNFPLAPVKPRIDGVAGNVTYEAGAPGGFQGQTELLRLTWEVKRVGRAVIVFGPGSQLLRHSANADAVPLALISASLNLTERDASLPAIVAKDFLDEAQWYSVPFVRLAWAVKPDATYSYVLSRLSDEQPDEVPDEPVGEIKLATPEDGVFYFHLRECLAGKCGPTVSRRVMKDVTPPAAFTPILGQSSDAFQGKRFISFATTDEASGIDRYEVMEGTSGAWEVVTSPFIMRVQSDDTKVTVRAYDKAGNVRESALDVLAQKGAGRFSTLVAAFILMVVLFILWRKKQASNQVFNK